VPPVLRLLLIDNYDSFTYNLAQALAGLGAEVAVARNDCLAVAAVLEPGLGGLALSPGPGRPEEAGICPAVLRALDAANSPASLEVTAQSPSGEIMALRHRTRPRWGVQFHPESLGSPAGPTLQRNFLRLWQVRG